MVVRMSWKDDILDVALATALFALSILLSYAVIRALDWLLMVISFAALYIWLVRLVLGYFNIKGFAIAALMDFGWVAVVVALGLPAIVAAVVVLTLGELIKLVTIFLLAWLIFRLLVSILIPSLSEELDKIWED
ncbi:hypothetical protein DRP07_00050 [Archaeoglobales archaeon]|nr:MAG: hypothetical protein DRP07_00050 [Archaeoglobales archaeon]